MNAHKKNLFQERGRNSKNEGERKREGEKENETAWEEEGFFGRRKQMKFQCKEEEKKKRRTLPLLSNVSQFCLIDFV